MTAPDPFPGRPSGRLALLALLAWLCLPPSGLGQEPGENAPDDLSENLPIPPVPPRIAEGPDYDKCMNLLDTDPSGADAFARAWSGSGGGEAAQHCLALAQVELGNSAEGAAQLDRIAGSGQAQSASRAEVFNQAAEAWTIAGDARHALASASQAVGLLPDDPDLRVSRAMAALALQQYALAADDLSAALEADAKRADALTLRATAWRNLDKLDLARADIDHAMAIDPQNADTLLERGILLQRAGDLAGAQQDWKQAAALAADTPTGDLAEQNLALLEAGPGVK